ncbi:MAG: MFS transporter [Clostridiales bacterium]|nr:MFS transporter [Clostridiales bacterium]
MNQKKQERLQDPYRMRASQQIGWSGRAVSIASNVVILAYITYYCTNILGMNSVLVGTLLLASKIFDGVSDLFAGVLIDKTHTKWGKARPYEFAIIGVWLGTILLFSCPTSLGTVGKAAWVFVVYSLVNAVFVTLLNASEAVYLVRAFKYEDDRNRLISVNGLLVTVFCTIISIIMPTLMATMGTTSGGWTRMMVIIGLPLTVIGMGRFIFVKEVNVVPDEKSELLTMKDFLPALKGKYIWLLVIITIFVNLITNINSAVGTYYFTYVVGDLAKMSLVSMFGLVSPLFLLFMPKLLKKFSVSDLFFVSFIGGIIGNVIKGFAGANMTLIMIGSFFQTMASLAPSYFTMILIIDVMDYHEWKTGNRVEGVISAINSFAGKLAGGLASGFVGIIMGIAGFDGNLATQSSSAMASISALYCWIPAAIYVILLILMKCFDLEKKMPQIKADLAARHAGESQ